MKRSGVTLTELLVSLAIGTVLFATLMGLHEHGLRTLDSDARRLDAAEATHRASDHVRRLLFSAPWAWPAPAKDAGALYLRTGGSVVRLQDEPGTTGSLFATDGRHVLYYGFESDRATGATGLPANRERVALVSASHLTIQAEEDQHRHIVWAEGHPWCSQGYALHAGYQDRARQVKPDAD